MVQPFRPQSTTPRTLFQYDITQQPTLTHPLVADENIQDTVQDVTSLSPARILEEATSETNAQSILPLNSQIISLFKNASVSRVLAVSLVMAIIIGLYLLWKPSSSSSTTVQSVATTTVVSTVSPTTTSSTTAADTSASGTTIQVYIVGAVEHPGVYTVDSQARVYQLLQKAGGPISTADLASLNLAARLNDGQEVDVLRIGEAPASSASTSSTVTVMTTPNTETQVNINTASADELKQQLSVSSKTAQTIISYRLQHGPFTSVDTLAQVVSQSIYKKIKDKVTVQ